jgi:hypothetical protein
MKVKIGCVSCNQTAGDWPLNLANMLAGVDRAVSDGDVDILLFEELCVTGYDCGDNFSYFSNETVLALLSDLARHAHSRAPNLVLSVGHPFYFADKNQSPRSVLNNRTDLLFNCQSLLSGGKVVATAAKSYLFNYERGYEKRHFVEWDPLAAEPYEGVPGYPGRAGTVFLPAELFAGLAGEPAVPFGCPVVQLRGRNEGELCNVFHVICEEAWIGSPFDGVSDHRPAADAAAERALYARQNPLALRAKTIDVTVALNPNASPPASGKIAKHRRLAELASEHCQVYAHADGLGSSGSTFSQFGSRLFAQGGRVTAQGARMLLTPTCAYTSWVATVESARPSSDSDAPHAVIEHTFNSSPIPGRVDGPAPWDVADMGPVFEMEEELRNELSWLWDYTRKNQIRGYVQALSGGADSAYNATKVRLMLEAVVSELGVDGRCPSSTRPCSAP